MKTKKTKKEPPPPAAERPIDLKMKGFRAGLLFSEKVTEMVLESAAGSFGKAQQKAAWTILRAALADAEFEGWRRSVSKMLGGI